MMKKRIKMKEYIKSVLFRENGSNRRGRLSFDEITRFCSDIRLRQFYKTECPERYADLKAIEQNRNSLREMHWRGLK